MSKKNVDNLWDKRAATILKTELAKRDLSYIDLQGKLKKAGIEQSIHNIRNKASRGTFASAFLLQCLCVIGVKTLHLADYYPFDDPQNTDK